MTADFTVGRKLTDERDDEFTIPAFFPYQFTPPVYLRSTGAFRDSDYELSTDFRSHSSNSRGFSPPREALGCDPAPKHPAAGRTLFRPHPRSAPEGAARRKRLRDWRRAGPFLLGAAQFAAVFIVSGIWSFVIFVLLILSQG